ncbi:MAG: hypothetical protein AAF092_06435 [Pseudomonadota bacterium]
MTKIVVRAQRSGIIPTSTKRPSKGQRETLEAILVNLGIVLEIPEIEKALSARGAAFYRPSGTSTFQSATNTILEMSENLVESSK